MIEIGWWKSCRQLREIGKFKTPRSLWQFLQAIPNRRPEHRASFCRLYFTSSFPSAFSTTQMFRYVTAAR
jgi:hypothetical protein